MEEKKIYFNTMSGFIWLIAWLLGYALRGLHILGSIIGGYAILHFCMKEPTPVPLILIFSMMTAYACVMAVSYSWLVFTWSNILTRD